MPDIPDDARPYFNEEFARRYETLDPPVVDVLVETEPGRAGEIVAEIERFQGAQIGQAGIINGKFIPVAVPEATVTEVARIPGVELVHQDQPVGVLQQPQSLPPLPFASPSRDPIRTAISNSIFNAFEPDDPYIGYVGISRVEIPQINFAQIPPGDPVQTALSALDEVAGTNATGQEFIPSSEAVDWILDAPLSGEGAIGDSKVAVLDTGHTPLPDANGDRTPRLESWVPGEGPLDFLGHGSWCTNMVAGERAPSPWGACEGVAPSAEYGHFKCLNSFPGFGKTSWILKAMERANEWGADVISMSLGGQQQGPIDQDPFCTFIRDNCKESAGDADGSIFVVAAGNSGPDGFTIGSPGVSEKALTVGSWSLMDAAPAVFSSRGPQGTWYGSNQDRYEEHLQQYSPREFVKPDVAAPGGGRENDAKASERDEFLIQTATGWSEGLYDGLKDARALMHGTSMGCPGGAGLVFRLYEEGLISTAADIKSQVSQDQTVPEFPEAAANANAAVGGKNVAVGYGPLRASVFA